MGAVKLVMAGRFYVGRYCGINDDGSDDDADDDDDGDDGDDGVRRI